MSTSSRLSSRSGSVQRSVNRELSRSAEAFARQGRPVVNLSSGFIPGDLPRDLRTIATNSWRDGHFTYLGGPGLDALRDAVVEWLDLRDLRTADDVLVSPGCRSALSSILAVLCGPGDVVLVDAGAWGIFHQLVTVSGVTPVPCGGSPRRHHRLSAGDVRQALEMMPSTRALLLANPVNTTAQLYSTDEIAAIVEVCAEHRVFCVIDRLYGKLLYDGARYPYVAPTPATRDWLVLVDGVSRAFRGAGGLRVGWACGPRDVIDAATVVQGHTSGAPGRVIQRVALAALQAPYDIGLLDELQGNRDVLLGELVRIPGVAVWPAPATMYAVADLSAYVGSATPVGWMLESSGDIADYLLGEGGVLVTPSELGGGAGLVRLSFSQPWDVLTEGAARIATAVGALRRAG